MKCLAVLILVVNMSLSVVAQSDLQIIHINIGQGSSTLILGPEVNGRRISVLYDCGQTLTAGSDKDGGKIIYDLLKDKGVQELDYLVISHYDADHLGGAIYGTSNFHRSSFAMGPDNVPGALGDDDNDGDKDWLDNDKIKFDFSEWGKGDDIKVKKIVDRGSTSTPTSKTYQKYRALTEATEYIALEEPSDFENYTIDLGAGAGMSCLTANGYVKGAGLIDKAKSENERSITFLIEYGAFDYLIGGDLIGKRGTESGPEDARLEYHLGKYIRDHMINIDVFQVNHHGANNTSEMAFLNLIKAEYAIISCGENKYGHPYPDNLERLLGSGVRKIYQTNRGEPKWTLSDYVKNRQKIADDHIQLSTNGVSFKINGDVYISDN
ncbi:hypothetical protein FNH22_11095 [Fulvivirga sp. M361]|uniref:ComEC/Rec2 family competence protein n=1 Tax=Fulvivirga sp. M361 TaxID=2594266 RepID=UPI00117A21F9|nr:MBL fold metallo-hydrolase [Fulvivirga sp. M361]TRX59066.1 hypothetical protein FNH22_11095 [Fulvivirga sp. M361]